MNDVDHRPAPIIERESWMDAQSVERVRLEEEYERESQHGIVSPNASGAKGPPNPMEEATSPESGRTSRKHKHGSTEGNSKSKSTEKGKKHRHHHQSHPKGRSDDESRVGGRDTQQGMVSPAKGRNIGAHLTSGMQDSKHPSNNGSGGMEQSAAPMVGPGVDVPGFESNNYPTPPPNFPWYSEQAQHAQVPLQPPGMPMQNAPWGQQAQQAFVNPSTAAAHFEHGPPPFRFPPPGLAASQPPLFNQQPFDQTAQMYAPPMPAPPFPGAKEYSPRTLPSALRFPFPPFGLPGGEAPQAWGMAGVAPSAGMPDMRWQAGPFQGFGGIPPGTGVPPDEEPHTAQPLRSAKTPTEHDETRSPGDQGSGDQSPVIAGTEQGPVDPKTALDSLRARMKKNAEDSRTALESERSGKRTSEQRMAALEKLVSPSSKKKVSLDGHRPVKRSADMDHYPRLRDRRLLRLRDPTKKGKKLRRKMYPLHMSKPQKASSKRMKRDVSRSTLVKIPLKALARAPQSPSRGMKIAAEDRLSKL